MTAYEIPLVASPQAFTITLSGISYRLRLFYVNSENSGWHIDIFNRDEEPLVCGIPLVPGGDLLAPYAYLGMNGMLIAINDNNPNMPGDYISLGDTFHLVWIAA